MSMSYLPHATGIRKLASGEIAEPVSYLDIALPEGYVKFNLDLWGFFSDVSDFLACALSNDAGASFLNDVTNFDSYSTLAFEFQHGPNTNAYALFDSLIMLNEFLDPAADGAERNSIISNLEIFPGDAATFPKLAVRFASYPDNRSGLITSGVSAAGISLSPPVVDPPHPFIANMIRIQPYGNGDCNPPTSETVLTAGSYRLWGIP